MLASKGILALKLPTRNVFVPSVLSLGYNSPLLLVNLTWKKLRISEFLGTETAKPCSLQFRIKVTKKERWDGAPAKSQARKTIYRSVRLQGKKDNQFVINAEVKMTAEVMSYVV